MMSGISKNNILKRTIAGILAGVISVSFNGGLLDSNKTISKSLAESDDYDVIINEEHLLSEASVDGKFDGEGSDYAIGGEGEYEDADKKRSINILEIVGDYRMAMLGFLIDGCEPVGTADMDAIVNTYPGQEAPQYQVYFRGCNDFNVNNRGNVSIYELAMNSGEHHAMYYYPKTMNGYYECVGRGKGAYALKEKPASVTVDGVEYIKNAVMVSKYANNKTKGYTDYDYVWVEDPSLKSFEKESTDHKTKLNDIKTNPGEGDRIYVYDHYKNKYVNNELFLCMMCNFIEGMDNTKGAYDGGSGWSTGGKYSDPGSIKTNANYARIQEWRKNNTITVKTLEASEVKCSDVDNADLIFFINGESDGSYKKVFGINCYATGDFSPKNSFSASDDISVDVMKRIFKHVVVNEDVALAYSHMNCTGTWNLDTNIKKLGFMLSYMKSADKYNEGVNGVGTGRDFYRYLFDDYGPMAGGSGYDTNGETVYFNDRRTTDYIKINDNGDLSFNGNVYSTWGAADYEFQNNWLYTDFLRNYFGRNGEMTYYIDGGDPGDQAKYRNQMIFKETWNMFMSNGGAKDLFSIMSKITPTPHYVTDGETKRSYFLSMNIVNGDSMTKEAGTDDVNDFNRNKTLYINKYEINEMPESFTLPLQIKIVTSHPIKSVKVTKVKRTGAPIQEINTYSTSSGVLKGGGKLETLELKDETKYTDGKAPYISEKDYYKYTLSGEVKLEKKWFKTGSNNTIMIETTNEVGKSAKDIITIVTRDFFGLN